MLYQTPNPHGGDVYTEPVQLDFSTSLNPLRTPPAVIDAIKQAAEHADCYPDPYCRKAMAVISRHEGVSPESILMGNGAAELIYSFCQAAAPRSALIAMPTFSEYEAALTGSGSRVIYHKLLNENDFILQENFAEVILNSRPNVVFLCNPNNPTGRLIDASLLRKVLTLCEIIKARLFLDESFLELSDAKPAMNALVAEHPSLFLLKSLTKSYALAGIRIGYCLSSDHYLLQRMSRSVQPWNVSTIAQAAAEAAMNEAEYIHEALDLIKFERKYLRTALSGLGFQVCPSEANFLLFRAQAGLDAELRKKGIAIRNCANFNGLGRGWFRIAVRKHEENERLIQAMEQIMKEHA